MQVLKVTAEEDAMRQWVTERENQKRNGTEREGETNRHKEHHGRCLIMLWFFSNVKGSLQALSLSSDRQGDKEQQRESHLNS